MKPLVGKSLERYNECLDKADKLLAEAEKLAYGAYGSHKVTLDVSTARLLIGGDSSLREYSQRALEPPVTRKVIRMTKGVDK